MLDPEDVDDTGPDDDDAAGNPPLTAVDGIGPGDPDATTPSVPVTAEHPDTNSSSTSTQARRTVNARIDSVVPRFGPEEATGPV